jgi:integrase
MGCQLTLRFKRQDRKKRKSIPLPVKKEDRIIEAFKTNRYYKYYTPLMEFLFFTGCRPSEAVALQWKHIGFKEITFR